MYKQSVDRYRRASSLHGACAWALVCAVALLASVQEARGQARGANDPADGTTQEAVAEKPEWLNRGAGVFESPDGKMLHAIGLATGDGDGRLQSGKARIDARRTLADLMREYVADMLRHWMESSDGVVARHARAGVAFREKVSGCIKPEMLQGAQLWAVWRKPPTNDLYVLIKIPLSRALEQARPEILKAAREHAAEHVKGNADQVLKELDQQIDKRLKKLMQEAAELKASRKPVRKITDCPDEPNWLGRGSCIHVGPKGKMLYAVGVAEHHENERMMKAIALQSARVELASQAELHVGLLVKDFLRSHRRLVHGNQQAIAFTVAVSRTITEGTLRGSQCVDLWRHCNGRRLYVLLGMPVTQALDQAKKDMMAKARQEAAETFKEDAADALAALDKEIDRQIKAAQQE